MVLPKLYARVPPGALGFVPPPVAAPSADELAASFLVGRFALDQGDYKVAAESFEQALKEQHVPFERQGPVTISIPQKLSQRAVDWLEDVSRVHCIGRRD